MTILQSVVVAVIGMVVVMVELALLAVIIMIISKIIRTLSEKRAPLPLQSQEPLAAAAMAAPPLPEGRSAGALNLHNVDDKTAAMVMAVVSHESGIPLNQLRFLSIKALDQTQEEQRP